MYWLMRSANSPPVSVVSPRNNTGLSLFRFNAPTVRWPEWMGWRRRSTDERSREESTAWVMAITLERVPECLPGTPELPGSGVRRPQNRAGTRPRSRNQPFRAAGYHLNDAGTP